MKTTVITVKKVEKRDSNFGIYNFKAPKYARIHHTTHGYCLYIEGHNEKGEAVHFFTPQAEITSARGMSHYDSLSKNTGNFFKEVKGEIKGHKSCFEGDTIMPIVIEDTTEIIPAVQEHDQITIQYGTEEIKYNQIRYKRVRLIS